MPPHLSPEAMKAALDKLPGWEIKGEKLSKSYHFFDFKEALAFVNKVAERAEVANHHPDIHLYYNRVELDLVTHEAGGITEKDVQFAQTLDPNY